MSAKWITPYMKQAFVVAGVSLNIANCGAVMGFTAVLLPQLRKPDSPIQVDTTVGSWIASIIGISLIVGNVLVPSIMKFGRKLASLFSCLLTLSGWIWITLATDVTSLLVARFLQGFALGVNLSLSPIMIGELTSPLNRGFFSSIMTSSITAATLGVHVIGSYLHWQTTALIFAFISFISFAILMFIPESPSWLAEKGRYDKSKKAFRWLRGDGDDEELERMIAARRSREVKTNTNGSETTNFFAYIRATFQRKEVYKPIVIMIHLYTISMWAGLSYLIVYVVDVIRIIVGENVDVALQLTILDCQRMVSTLCILFVVRILKRRLILFTSVGLNIFTLVAIAIYSYAKENDMLYFDHPAIGMTLIHIHMCSLTIGALPLPIVLSAELFPQEFRSLAGGISALSFSINYFVTTKTALILVKSIGVYGAYMLYAGITLYSLIVVALLLPETKDKTLQDIEEKFKGEGKKKNQDNVLQALTSDDQNKENA